jgi:hypothetical protein
MAIHLSEINQRMRSALKSSRSRESANTLERLVSEDIIPPSDLGSIAPAGQVTTAEREDG